MLVDFLELYGLGLGVDSNGHSSTFPSGKFPRTFALAFGLAYHACTAVYAVGVQLDVYRAVAVLRTYGVEVPTFESRVEAELELIGRNVECG